MCLQGTTQEVKGINVHLLEIERTGMPSALDKTWDSDV